MTLPVQQVGRALGNVMLSTLAGMGDDHARVGVAYRRAARTVNLISVPVLAGVASTAPALVPFLYGGNWGPMIPLLMILCAAGVPQALTITAGWLYQSQGRTGRGFAVAAVLASGGVLLMLAGLQWGALGVACAVLVRSWVGLPISLYFACTLVQLRTTRVMLDALPNWLTSGVMFGIVWWAPAVLGIDRDSVDGASRSGSGGCRRDPPGSGHPATRGCCRSEVRLPPRVGRRQAEGVADRGSFPPWWRPSARTSFHIRYRAVTQSPPRRRTISPMSARMACTGSRRR